MGSRRARSWHLALVVAAIQLGCAAAPEARFVKGAEVVAPAREAMATDGVVLAPYVAPAWLGAEQTQAHYQCIGAVNRAVYAALAKRFTVVPPPPSPPGAPVPRWARSPIGPRVAVHVAAIRCGEIAAQEDFTLTPLATDTPREAPPPALTREGPPGQVILEVIDRRSGMTALEVLGESGGDGPEAAAADAARAAIATLVGP